MGVREDVEQPAEIPETAHQISTDSWFQVGFVLTTGINSAYVLGYSGAIMVPLGWVFGIVGLLGATAISLYANALVAKLHEHGGKRHIRYRDLAGFIYGRKAYSITWALQYVNLFMINTGYIILAGQAAKAVYVLFRDDHTMKLPYFIAIAGVVCAMFAIGIPHLSALRIWLGVSTFFSLVYIIVAFVLSLKDGMKAPPRNYSIPSFSGSNIFAYIGAAANLVFAFNTGKVMGLSPSKRVSTILADSPEFDSSCTSVFSECLALTQHAFSGVRPYQLGTASDRLHFTLTTIQPHPLISKWVPSPPTRSQVDKAFRDVQSTNSAEEEILLGRDEFKAFAVDLFTDAIVSNAGKAVLQRVPIGIGGIVGIGIATRSGKDLVGTAIGVYALGVATSIYLGLSG